jgi:hypothetical protein
MLGSGHGRCSVTGLWTNDRDTLAEAIGTIGDELGFLIMYQHKFEIARHLIDSGAVQVLDPGKLARALTDPLAERQDQHLQLCPAGCGCRYMTDDPDARECACDGACCFDEGFWDGLTDAEFLARVLHTLGVTAA